MTGFPPARQRRRMLASVVLAFVAAEVFFKFGSFALETGAFMLTWLAVSAVASGLRTRLERPG